MDKILFAGNFSGYFVLESLATFVPKCILYLLSLYLHNQYYLGHAKVLSLLHCTVGDLERPFSKDTSKTTYVQELIYLRENPSLAYIFIYSCSYM